MTLPAHPKALERVSCAGVTKAGNPCRNKVVGDDGYCIAHSRNPEVRSRFGGVQPGAGRPKREHPYDIWREQVIGEFEEWIAPYREVLDNAVIVSTTNGRVTVSDVPDLGAKVNTVEKVFDRLFGKAAQRTEVTGAGGGPVSIAHLVLSLNDVTDE